MKAVCRTMVFRNAFNYISQASSQLLNGQTADVQHPLVGSTIEIGTKQYNVRALLAEGGFALVFSVQETKTGQWFALKRQLAADRIAADAVLCEINFLKLLSGNPAIIRFNHATQISPDKRLGQQYYAEFLILTELCTGGPLIDYMRRAELTAVQICKIFHSVCVAVRHMHDRNPPITHRDIKIENLLFDSRGFIKLCDFGSATTDIYRPSEEWNALMRSELEEEMAKFTTPMYRAPEILETYQNYPIGPAQDIWALGCVLFYLCYKVHPFEDSAKLRIINAKYTLPAQSPFQVFNDLIRQTLQPDPYSRPSIQDLCEQVEDIAMALDVNLAESIVSPEQLESLIQADGPAPSNSLGSRSARVFLDQGINLIKTIKEKSPALNISEQLRTQPGSSSSQLSSMNSRETRKTAPPRPPHLPPSFQTKITQLTQKEPENLHTTLKTAEESFVHPSDEMATSQAQNIPQNPPSTDFFATLSWDAEKKVEPEPANPRRAEKHVKNIASELGQLSFGRAEEHLEKASSSNGVDLLTLLEEELPSQNSSMQRNKSAPTFVSADESSSNDIFAEFLSDKPGEGGQEDKERQQMKKANEGGADYSRNNFAKPEEQQPRRGGAFDDLLSEHGFTSSTKQSNRTLADLVKERDQQELDPIELKIKYWTEGKQRNIRALLISLTDVLWEEAKLNWTQPNVADLFELDKIKKYYRKACLVVHPDKQSGTANETLAKAIFTELNDAWNELGKSSR